jgi:beta-1,4-mannosyltransferase
MRVLAKPASEAGGADPYPRLLYTPMRSHGVTVDEFTAWRAIRGRYDIFHLHWPEYYIAHRNPFKAYVGSIMLLSLIFWCRFRGAKVIWTVHNLGSHNKPRPYSEEVFWKLFTRILDGYISLNRAGLELIRKRFPAMDGLPHVVIPSIYRGAFRNTTHRLEARRLLRLPSKRPVLLFFGSLARYKGIPQLIEAFRNRRDPEAILYIVGAVVDREIGLMLSEASMEDLHIRLHLSRVTSDELELYIKASDLVVLPYSDVFNSGCALVSLALDRPVLVPEMGAMHELQEVCGPEWVRAYDGTLKGTHLEQAMNWALHGERPDYTPLDKLDWNNLAVDTLSFYHAVSKLPGNDSFPMAESEAENAEGGAILGQRDELMGRMFRR